MLHGIPRDTLMDLVVRGKSMSVYSKEPKLYTSSIVGCIIPIALGTAKAQKESGSDRKTWCFIGDMTFESGIFYEAYKYAKNFNLPLQFVVEDNNLSILTEKKVRRTWDIHDVARGFGMKAFNIPDSPETIREYLDGVFTSPLLLNINTISKYWHSGAGIDDDDVFDRYEYEMDRVDNGKEIHEKYKQNVEKLWKNQLEKR